MTKCIRPECNSPIPVNKRLCPACQSDNGCPNVRAASDAEETAALQERYDATIRDCESRGCQAIAEKFKDSAAGSCAVHAATLTKAEEICKGDNILFDTFAGRIMGGTRTLGDDFYDKIRPAVEAKLFPHYEEEIRYAALSLTGHGVPSFGPISFVFKDEAIADRATVFEENSIHFFDTHNVYVHEKVPPGHCATWDRRGVLALAKVGHEITTTTGDADFQGLLIQPGTPPKPDRILEVHIYGSCNQHSIECVIGPKQFSRKADQVRWKDIQQCLQKAVGAAVELTA